MSETQTDVNKGKSCVDINNNDCVEIQQRDQEIQVTDTLPFTFTTSDYVLSTPNEYDDTLDEYDGTGEDCNPVTALTNNQSQLSLPNLSCVLQEETSSPVPNTVSSKYLLKLCKHQGRYAFIIF